MTSIVIPNKVKIIDYAAFKGCTGLISVRIPDSATEIGSSTFEGCTSLTSIRIPDSVTEISSSTFEGCTSLTSIVIPNRVNKIGYCAFKDCTGSSSTFKGCTSLTSIVIPNRISEIGSGAFKDCTSLISVTISQNVTTIGENAFKNCPNLTIICSEGSYAQQYCKDKFIPYIFDYQYEAFNGLLPTGYKKLASPFLADEEKPFIFISYSHKDRDEVLGVIKKLYESGWKIWYDEGLTIGDRYDETLENHVRDCSAFLLFVTKNSLNSMYCRENEIPWAIQYGKPIIRCILDERVKYPIREDAVAATVFPAEAESALAKIDGLTKGEQRIATGISVIVNPGDRDESDHEGKEEGFAYCLHADQNTAVIKAIQLEAKNSGCSLYDASEEGEDREKLQNSACLVVFLDKAFLSDKHLTDILIKEYHAGKDIAVCMVENIEDTDLPEELIGLHKMQWLNYAFGISNDMNTKLFRHLQKRGCRNIAVLPGFEYEKTDEGIIIRRYTGLDPNPRIEGEYGGIPVIAILDKAFYNNHRLNSVVIDKGLLKIGSLVFKNCVGLTSVVIPDSVTAIGESAFEGCKNLASIVMSNNVTKIGERTFKDCSSLISVVIPDGVREIGYEAFKGCTNLTLIDIPGMVTGIDYAAFETGQHLNITCPPGSAVWLYCKKHGICVSPTKSRVKVLFPESETRKNSENSEICVSSVKTRFKSLFRKIISRNGIEPKDAKHDEIVSRTDIESRNTKPESPEVVEKYIYVSYCKKNTDMVYEILTAFHNKGYRLLYDNKPDYIIEYINEFRKDTAKKIKNCAVFLCLLSTDYQESEYCMREFHYAFSQTGRVFPVFLTKFEISDELVFVLERAMAQVSLYWYDSISEFVDKMESSYWEIFDPCRKENTED